MPTFDLKCPICGHRFRYKSTPAASMTALRFVSKRYIRCPSCKRYSFFDITKSVKPKSPISSYKMSAYLKLTAFLPIILAFLAASILFYAIHSIVLGYIFMFMTFVFAFSLLLSFRPRL